MIELHFRLDKLELAKTRVLLDRLVTRLQSVKTRELSIRVCLPWPLANRRVRRARAPRQLLLVSRLEMLRRDRELFPLVPWQGKTAK
jgi:hypothetical protein